MGRKRQTGFGWFLLSLFDRWGLQATAAVVALIWLGADIFGFSLSKGTEAALASWVAYAALQWRRSGVISELQGESKQFRELRESVDDLAKTDPNSPEGRAAAARLVALAKSEPRAKKSDGEK